jgi:hypothetical protein
MWTADHLERDYCDVVVWRPIGPPGWNGHPLEGWLRHFENIVERWLRRRKGRSCLPATL